MKPTVYILLLANGQFYIGSTDNLERRVQEHNHGKSLSTRHKRPVTLVFHQECDSLVQARHIEYRIKRLKSRHVVENIVRSGKIQI